MSLENRSSLTYNTSVEQKRKSKNDAKLYRFGTPKLRDILREKCRIRVKEARRQSFSQHRPGDVEPEKINLEYILRQELAELEYNISLQEEIYQELVTEINDWIVDQLEGEENYLFEVADSEDLVCPICQKLNLVVFQSNEDYFDYRCKCGAKFNSTNDLECLRQKLFNNVDTHEHNCSIKLTFFVNPLTKQLEAICDNCDYFGSL